MHKNQHQFHEDSVVYFGKYLITSLHDDYREFNEFKRKKLPKDLVIAAGFVAAEFNDNKYVKKEGEYEFVDWVDDDGLTKSRYLMTKMPNREIITAILFKYPHLITQKYIDKAQKLISYLELDFMFKVLADDMNDFEKSILSIIASDEIGHNDYGTVAYSPLYLDRIQKERELEERSSNSDYLISERADGKVELVIEVLRVVASTNFPGYNVSAITDDGNRVSFFTSKHDFLNNEGEWFGIVSKIKSNGFVWGSSIKETRLHYVKVI